MIAKNKKKYSDAYTPLLVFLSKKLTAQDKMYFFEECSELHPPNSCTIDDLWRPLQDFCFPGFFDLQTLENIYFALEDDGFKNKYRNLYICSLYIYCSNGEQGSIDYFANYILNTLTSITGDLDAVSYFYAFIEGVNKDNRVPVFNEQYYIKIALFILTRLKGLDDTNCLAEIEDLYKSAFGRQEHNSDWVKYWKSLKYDDFNLLKKYFLEYTSL